MKIVERVAEDASFYEHEGIDYDELREAIQKNLERGTFARGASTISQQLAKNLFLSTLRNNRSHQCCAGQRGDRPVQVKNEPPAQAGAHSC